VGVGTPSQARLNMAACNRQLARNACVWNIRHSAFGFDILDRLATMGKRAATDNRIVGALFLSVRFVTIHARLCRLELVGLDGLDRIAQRASNESTQLVSWAPVYTSVVFVFDHSIGPRTEFSEDIITAKCVFYHKSIAPTVVIARNATQLVLDSLGIHCKVMEYGQYSMDMFRDMICAADFVVLSDSTETQGYAESEIMALDVPCSSSAWVLTPTASS
jgi:hypothetical protein